MEGKACINVCKWTRGPHYFLFHIARVHIHPMYGFDWTYVSHKILVIVPILTNVAVTKPLHSLIQRKHTITAITT